MAAILANATKIMRFLSPEEAEAERLEQARGEIARLARDFRAKLEPTLSDAAFAKLVRDPKLQGLADRYHAGRGSVLALGPAGIGKTLAIKRVGRRLLRDAWRAGDVDAPIVRAVWTSAPELTAALRETRFGSSCQSLRDAQRAPILILDEIGQELHDPRWLLELLDARYAPPFRPTLTTSGLTHTELVARYGSGTVRRLSEPVGTVVDLFGGGA